jgi:hypothetical protein
MNIHDETDISGFIGNGQYEKDSKDDVFWYKNFYKINDKLIFSTSKLMKFYKLYYILKKCIIWKLVN